MSIKAKILICAFILWAIQGCNTFVSFEDISGQSKYSGLINKSYKTKIEFLVHGVNMDETIGKDIHIYSVTPHPGIGGREIISQTPLEIGSIIRVAKILRCTNCYLDFSPRINIWVDILSDDKYSDHDVYFGSSWGGMEISTTKNNAVVMNPEYFELVK